MTDTADAQAVTTYTVTITCDPTTGIRIPVPFAAITAYGLKAEDDVEVVFEDQSVTPELLIRKSA